MSGLGRVLSVLSNGWFETRHGLFEIHVFHDGLDQAIAISRGIREGSPGSVLCRIHSECISAHVFFATECDCLDQMERAQRLVARRGEGIIIYLQQEGRGSGAAAHVATLDLKRQGVPQPEAYRRRGFSEDLRRYEIAAKVLEYFEISNVELLSANLRKKSTLEKYGIEVDQLVDFTGSVVGLGSAMDTILGYKTLGLHQPIDRSSRNRWIFVLGDLNVDFTATSSSEGDVVLDRGEPSVGGTGVNAARSFQAEGVEPILIGEVGDDFDGRFVRSALESMGITSFVAVSEDLPTGTSSIIFDESNRGRRYLLKDDGNNANEYDLDGVSQALAACEAGDGDIVFLACHSVIRHGLSHFEALVDLLTASCLCVVLDLVPHNMHEHLSVEQKRRLLEVEAAVIVGELGTLVGLADLSCDIDNPSQGELVSLASAFRAKLLFVRLGVGNISRQLILARDAEDGLAIVEDRSTGYEALNAEDRVGFGDRLTAASLGDYWELVCGRSQHS